MNDITNLENLLQRLGALSESVDALGNYLVHSDDPKDRQIGLLLLSTASHVSIKKTQIEMRLENN